MTSQSIKEKTENKIIDWIAADSDARLVVVKPDDKKSGADLVVKRKGEYEAESWKNKSGEKVIKVQAFLDKKHKAVKEIFLLVFTQEDKVDEASLEPKKNFYAVFAVFDLIKQDINDEIRIINLNNKKEFKISKKMLSQFLIGVT